MYTREEFEKLNQAKKEERKVNLANEPEDEDSMQGANKPMSSQYSQNPEDWLAQSIRQSVSEWKKMLKKSETELKTET